jgi:hypothetical protein
MGASGMDTIVRAAAERQKGMQNIGEQKSLATVPVI